MKSSEHAQHEQRKGYAVGNDDDALHISLKNAVSNNKAIQLFFFNGQSLVDGGELHGPKGEKYAAAI